MRTPIRICHLTTVHKRYDTRIFVKQCRGLAKKGYDVNMVVADGQGHEEKGGVNIIDVGKSSGRIKRILFAPRRVLKKALELDGDIYHFHDPELLSIASKLIKKNKIVIYDAHEDLPRQLLDKPYIPSFLRKPISRVMEYFEDKVVSEISGVVTVTPEIKKRFLKSNIMVVEVRNFPLLEEFNDISTNGVIKGNFVCYVGGISKIRGVVNMVDAMQDNSETRLLLGGKFESSDLREKVEQSKGWSQVDELGFLNRDEVGMTLERSIAGLVVLEPTLSYLSSIPVKMFEYMIAGIPVIASDFEYWRVLIEQENCALFVDPLEPEEISKAIQTLINDKELASDMGSRGKKAVREKFNWSQEEKKLLRFYENLLS